MRGNVAGNQTGIERSLQDLLRSVQRGIQYVVDIRPLTKTLTSAMARQDKAGWRGWERESCNIHTFHLVNWGFIWPDQRWLWRDKPDWVLFGSCCVWMTCACFLLIQDRQKRETSIQKVLMLLFPAQSEIEVKLFQFCFSIYQPACYLPAETTWGCPLCKVETRDGPRIAG